MKFIKTENTNLIHNYRLELYKNLTAPIEAEWELLNVASAHPYLIEIDSKTVGYCCINDDKSLLQLFLENNNIHLIEKVVKELIDSTLIVSAHMGSNEPIAFNACLFHSKSIKTHTFCFEYAHRSVENTNSLNIEKVTSEDIPLIKDFFKNQLGFDDSFGYTENLVDRKEIFMIKESDTIVATSECRLSESQPEIASLGMIVNKDHRGKGIATQILKQQAKRVLDINRKPICSTTIDNIASKKAIEKAGFYCSNIMFDISFI